MPAPRSFLTAFLSLPVLLVASTPGLAAGLSRSAAPLPGVKSASQQATFTVDAVPITATTRFRPSARFVLPKSGDLTQTAGSSTLSPFSASTSTVSAWTVQAFEPVTGWLHRICSGHTLH